jgi:hypothetical protein
VEVKTSESGTTATLFIGWRRHLLDQGSKYLESASDEMSDAKPFLDAHGNPTMGNLYSNGTKAGEGQVPNYKLYNKFPLAEFNNLYLGPTVWSAP